MQFGYSRKVTGRMSFQVSGGPEFIERDVDWGDVKRRFNSLVTRILVYSRARTNFGSDVLCGCYWRVRSSDRSTNAERPVYGGTFFCAGLDDKFLSWIFQQQRFGYNSSPTIHCIFRRLFVEH